VVVAAAVFAFVPPVPQWPEYHDFADRRAWLGVPNFLDVFSNALFTLTGLAGLHRLLAARRRPVLRDARERWPWLAFFLALVLLGPASACYHLAPDNARLFWDRLAMSAVFMAWLAIQFAERIGARTGVLALPVLLAVGAGAVLYWIMSEAAGTGDLRAYGLAHFYPMLLIPLLLWLFPARYTRAGDVLAVLGLYGLALAVEWLDRPLFDLTGLVSGHTLKHLLATLAAAWALHMLIRRRPLQS
jgi:predicted membrane channel-forming protein YqfA (hemolysin III family)